MSKRYPVLRAFTWIDHETGVGTYAAVGTVHEGPTERWYFEDDPDHVNAIGVKGVRVGGDGNGPLLGHELPAETKSTRATANKES